ncbi:hypothetical protein HT031_004289 [Scenedesmus sp. PABB004]|nr:hypothetical protein HT031_004289 [Scenedesmus sp. PABB004]
MDYHRALSDLRVVVCGGGHGAKAAAAAAGAVGAHTAVLLSDTPRHRARAAELSAAIAARGGLAAHAAGGAGGAPVLGRVAAVTQLLVIMPGAGALDLLRLRRALGARCEAAFAAGLTYAAAETLPWSTRARGAAGVDVRGVTGPVSVVAFPSTPMSRLAVAAVLSALCGGAPAAARFQVEDHWLEASAPLDDEWGAASCSGAPQRAAEERLLSAPEGALVGNAAAAAAAPAASTGAPPLSSLVAALSLGRAPTAGRTSGAGSVDHAVHGGSAFAYMCDAAAADAWRVASGTSPFEAALRRLRSGSLTSCALRTPSELEALRAVQV